MKSNVDSAQRFFGSVGPVTGAISIAQKLVATAVVGKVSVFQGANTSNHPRGERIIVIGREHIEID